MREPARPRVDEDLVRRLVAAQFPQWADLSIAPVRPAGWNNCIFHLGETMLARLPRHEAYVPQVEKEQAWLPRLAPFLPLEIPAPLGLGRAGEGYPWPWSVYRWIDGESARTAAIPDRIAFAHGLAGFLAALQSANAADGPPAGQHNFFRGGPIATYDVQTREAVAALAGRIDAAAALAIWDHALAAGWTGPPVWVHGDVAPGNLIVRNGCLAAVIDWGILGVGDPACDLAIAWTFFDGEARSAFRATLPLDQATWLRARGWCLWKALILVAGFSGPEHPDAADAPRVLAEVLADAA